MSYTIIVFELPGDTSVFGFRNVLPKHIFVYYEETKRELNRILIYECRCDETLRSKPEGSTRLVYTGLSGGLEHLKIETRLRDERFERQNES
jgi:hypothetical protein